MRKPKAAPASAPAATKPIRAEIDGASVVIAHAAADMDDARLAAWHARLIEVYRSRRRDVFTGPATRALLDPTTVERWVAAWERGAGGVDAGAERDG